MDTGKEISYKPISSYSKSGTISGTWLYISIYAKHTGQLIRGRILSSGRSIDPKSDDSYSKSTLNQFLTTEGSLVSVRLSFSSIIGIRSYILHGLLLRIK